MVPEARITSHTKRWWTEELSTKRKEFQWLSHQSHRNCMYPDLPVHELYHRSRNEYSELITNTKEAHWAKWLEETSEDSIWDVHRLATGPSSDRGRTWIPGLKVNQRGQIQEITSNEGKSKTLHKLFFPPPPANPEAMEEEEYPDPVHQFQNITEAQIECAIDKLKPYKVMMADDIANVVLKETKAILIPYLAPIYHSTFHLNHYYASWKVYDLLVLWKPRWTNYTASKLYRPIVLLKTLGKLLSMAVAEDVSYIVEKHNLLPKYHFGVRSGWTTTDAIHLLVKYIQDVWRAGKVISVLFLDVKGAFLSMDIQRLKHKMRRGAYHDNTLTG